MNLKTRKRLSLLILLLGLPAYLIVAWVLLAWIDDTYGRPPFWAELLIVILLGFVWIMPFKKIFTGIGKGEE
ncbi:DUF2842 domain-containing protein [Paracoccus sp. SCSIO 75233]|uniref:DUF2842 domain-containing protein n=1 Tax=Paracoccus sp. SCSIO 75233 TaxID=3017782 RepID=UPI0022F12D42|nr:DUF2842 domain-containing protein [Paracoccus sp. SCSIO 75233]WBU54514.1 DUF2842 domain-containing protein [Paracoccus sp. SCSIO 75233]